MVRLDRITTRTGDSGTTALADGRRVAKDHPRIQVIGAVDEANSVLGLVRLETLPEAISALLPRIQNDLFDLGADLATPPGSSREAQVPRLSDRHLARLDGELERANALLPPLGSFILPGGSRAAALLHLARTVVRRAERDLVALMHAEASVNPQTLCYLNRLSDLCFVWARSCNAQGTGDAAWIPGPAEP